MGWQANRLSVDVQRRQATPTIAILELQIGGEAP
jgi:hypothetical protein